jgi:hypothetical protein
MIPLLALLACLPVLGGASCGETRVNMPAIVEVPVKVVVEVDPALTKPCYDEAPRNQTTEEAVRLAKLRKASLAECSGRMKQIRELKR